ncbi:MAG: glycosyltransferase family 2 protein, partial [Patescibacteria group bacterium]
MTISIIIINYKTTLLLQKCLESIKQIYDKNIAEIIVVDNSPSDDLGQFLEAEFSNTSFLKNDDNHGFGQANNQAAKIAQGDILFFLNPDTLIQENIFQKIINAFEQDPKIGIVAPQLILPDNSFQPWAYGKEGGILEIIKNKFFTQSTKQPSNQLTNTDWVSGAAMAIRRDIFEKVNGFDEKFFMYFEDIDLCLRTKKLGYKIAVLPDAKII